MTTRETGRRFDLELLAQGFPLTWIKQRTTELIAFARRPNTPNYTVGGGTQLGFNHEVLEAMAAKWEITQADIDTVNRELGL